MSELLCGEKTLRSYESTKALNKSEIEEAKTTIEQIEADIKVRETNIEFCDWIIEKIKEHIAEAKEE